MTAGLDDAAQAFLAQDRAAAMVTLREDGTAHAVRVGVALVDGKLWSSGTKTRLRTRHLRRDPRSTLFVFDSAFRWLALECRVRILDGPDAPELNLRLFRVMQGVAAGAPLAWFGRQVPDEEFRRIMANEQRLIYEFDVMRVYGMYGESP